MILSADQIGDFCMTDDRFLLADFINQPTLSIVWHPLKMTKRKSC